MSHTLLLVEDDAVYAKALFGYLTRQGFQVSHAGTGQAALAAVQLARPEAIILDANLPDTDGFDVCRALRQHQQYQGPILMLTARDDTLDEVVGLEIGADDYIKKPAEPRLVLARLRACLRRVEPTPSPAAHPELLRYGRLTINRSARSVRLGSEAVVFTDAEFDLLLLLASAAGQTLSRDDIYRAMRGIEYDGLDRSIDMRVSRLRKLLGDDPDNPQLIKTVRGKGYLFSSEGWE